MRRLAENAQVNSAGAQLRQLDWRWCTKVGPSRKDTSREAQGDALLQNRAESQELLELRHRKLSQLKLEPVMRLGYVLKNAGSARQGVRGTRPR